MSQGNRSNVFSDTYTNFWNSSGLPDVRLNTSSGLSYHSELYKCGDEVESKFFESQVLPHF